MAAKHLRDRESPMADERKDTKDLAHDIDSSRVTSRWRDEGDVVKDLFHLLEWNIIDGEFTGTEELIDTCLKEGIKARTLISGPMALGIEEVGRRFKADEFFLPEVMVSAKCMHAALAILKPLIVEEKMDDLGTCVIGTIHGDIHDIGKNIVSMMLEAAGFTVVDLGVSVPPEDFIQAIKDNSPVIVGLSALLTTTMNMQGETIKGITAAGLRERITILVGGAPVTQEWAEKIGADAYCEDAMVAVDKAKVCINAQLPGGHPALAEKLLASG
jgi:5-methyltetrahydrofolate--homocysteine methyltransferase